MSVIGMSLYPMYILSMSGISVIMYLIISRLR